ncbi:MAG: membrane protein insertase YidC, partial [Alphaproteobacteria bacterium]|nr:membrane protein insertase YidC [Alphaproteobacteria bacterium]
MDDQNKNLILATALSFLVILVWFVLFPPPEPEPVQETPTTEAPTVPGAAPLAVPQTGAEPSAPAVAASAPAQEAAADAPRVTIDTGSLEGSISLLGGRIDDLALKGYRETLDDGSPIVTLLIPEGEPEAYYATYGWTPTGGLTGDDVPGASTLWSVAGNDTLTAQDPVTLEWTSPQGMIFRRQIAVDEDFLFTVTQSVENPTGAPVRLGPYARVFRHGEPSDQKGFFIIHEGAIRQNGQELEEFDYGDLRDFGPEAGWGASADVVN